MRDVYHCRAFRIARRISGALAVLSATGCATVRTHSDYDTTANFSAYRTYSWKNDTPVSNAIVDQRIVRAVDGALARKGLMRTNQRSDLLVTYHAAVAKRLEMESFTYGYGPGYRWGPWYGSTYSATTNTRVKEVKEGTLVVDLIDVARNQLVWRGLATDELRPSSDPRDSQERLDDAVGRMFRDYPPR